MTSFHQLLREASSVMGWPPIVRPHITISVVAPIRTTAIGGAKPPFVAKLTSTEPPRPWKSQLSFNDIGNVTEPLQGNGAVLGFAALRSSSKAQTMTERRVRAIAIQKLNWRSKMELFCNWSASGTRLIDTVVIASALILFVSCPAATSLRGNHDRGARLA